MTTAVGFLQSAWQFRPARKAIEILREFGHFQPLIRRVSGYRVPYVSFAEARRAAAQKTVGYETCKPDLYSAFTEALLPGDYQAMFWLQQLFANASNLFDFGGNIGTQFYSYSRYISIPPTLTWKVCDIDPFVQYGIELAGVRSASQLKFTYSISEGDGADIFLASGSLHYLEEIVGAALKRMTQPPPHLIVNRVPLIDQPTTVTLQDIGGTLLPCVLWNRDEFLRSVGDAGYTLRDSWTIAELRCAMPLYPDRSAQQYCGFYFIRKPTS
ncbi:MAG: methyltransferase, TIGR04325 family [Bryobacteraceae bacterium]|nr:methyltransferase, TIGR04325 family [Bryobacteraceae bacterium]